MKDFAALISMWPSLKAFAGDLGVRYVTAQMMNHRNSIAPQHWPKVVAGANARAIEGVSFETLVGMAASRAKAKAKAKAPRRVMRKAA